MDDFDPVELERVRRHGRPDWRRFVRPDWERYVHPAGHEAMRKQFALWDRAFEHPSARRLRAEQELQEHAEQIALERKLAAIQQEYEARERAWEAECAARKRKADLAFDRLMAAFMRGDFARKANFNPDQPRDELGRWTDGEGASDHDDGRTVSDAETDNFFKPGAQLAQSDVQRYSVNLDEEELRGGHTLRNHVGKTDEELLAKVRDDRGSVGISRYARVREGSFNSRESANDFVNRTLERNQGLVDEVANGKSDGAFVKARFGHKTGREAFRPSIDSEPYLRDTFEVGVEIRRAAGTARGYRVHTAYPRNESPR